MPAIGPVQMAVGLIFVGLTLGVIAELLMVARHAPGPALLYAEVATPGYALRGVWFVVVLATATAAMVLSLFALPYLTAVLALIAIALAPAVVDLAERDVRVHHLEHAALLGGGGMLGLVLGLALRPPGHRLPWERFPIRRRVALGLVLLEPLVVMAAMAPSSSAWIDTHPLAHALEHLALVISGGVIGLSARLFSTALGWLVMVLVTAMAAAFGGMALAHPVGLMVAGGSVVMAIV